VLPKAVVRCQRVDESFVMTAASIESQRSGIFEKLKDNDWKRIKGWPASALQEVAIRAELIGTSSEDLRLNEIEARISSDDEDRS
jgi:hypothetical protein